MQRGFIILLCLALLISACSAIGREPSAQEPDGQQQQMKKQASQRQSSKSMQKEDRHKGNSAKEVKLTIAQEANQIALKTKGVVRVASVAIDKQLSLAVDVEQMQRWNLKKIRKEIFHQLRERFPDLDIHVSSDRKILWELQKLEKEMYVSSPDVDSIEKKLKKINEDMKG